MNRKTVLIVAVLFIFITVITGCGNANRNAELRVGTVRIFSGGEEYAPLSWKNER